MPKKAPTKPVKKAAATPVATKPEKAAAKPAKTAKAAAPAKAEKLGKAVKAAAPEVKVDPRPVAKAKPAAKASKAAPKVAKAAKAPKAPKAPKAAKTVKAPKAAPAPKAEKPAPVKAAKPVSAKSGKTGPKKGRGRVTSPSGPLSNAVVSVLKRARRPLSCREITDALIKKNYQFTHPEPKRIVSIRIYKLKGVKQTAPGRFTFLEEEVAAV